MIANKVQRRQPLFYFILITAELHLGTQRVRASSFNFYEAGFIV